MAVPSNYVSEKVGGSSNARNVSISKIFNVMTRGGKRRGEFISGIH